MAKSRVQTTTLFKALQEVKKELDNDKISDRRRKRSNRFYDELIEELNSRAELWVAEPNYIDDLDRGRVI